MNSYSKFRIKDFINLVFLTVLILSLGSACQKGSETTLEKGEKMYITKEPFGQTATGENITLYVLTNSNGLTMKVINYGAIVTSLLVPDRDGKLTDVVLGFDNLESYLGEHPYFGAVVGRYGNRIAKGRFSLFGEEYTLATNNNSNHLHGGIKGFDKRVWQAEELIEETRIGIQFEYVSEDGEEGYPGNLRTTVKYFLTEKNEFRIEYSATTDKATPVNLTQHSYFNLAGTGNVLDHLVTIQADRYTVVNDELIPTGELRPVADTAMDFRQAQSIGARINQVLGGYDHNWVLTKRNGSLALAATVYEETSGRQMEVFTTEPGLQFYTGNFLDGSLTGKFGNIYQKHAGFCMETQHFPDSPNQPDFPSTVLEPGETYSHSTIYRFSIK